MYIEDYIFYRENSVFSVVMVFERIYRLIDRQTDRLIDR